MADTTTLNETTRTIDGTEYVRLATAGANWKALLSSIFSSLGREKLTADRNLYVRKDGSDSNTGLGDSTVGAFLTVTKAVQAAYKYDAQSLYTVYINIGAGTYDETISISGPLIGGIFSNFCLWLIGADASGSTILTSTTGNTISADSGAFFVFKNLKIRNGHSGSSCVQTNFGAVGGNDSGVIMDTTVAGVHFNCFHGSKMFLNVAYSLTGDGARHISLDDGCYLEQFSGAPVAVSGVLNFTTAFCYAQHGGVYSGTDGFSGGTVTGQRYFIGNGGIVDTFGGGANYFPGNVAGSGGTTAGGGYYS